MTRGHQAWLQLMRLLVEKGIISAWLAENYPIGQGVCRPVSKDLEGEILLDAICHYENESCADVREYWQDVAQGIKANKGEDYFQEINGRVVVNGVVCGSAEVLRRLELYPTESVEVEEKKRSP